MTDPRPPRRSLFAVWRWPRWTWGIIVPLAIVAYPFSAVPVNYVIVKAGLWNTPARTCFEIVYAPIVLAIDKSQFARDVAQWQVKWMSAAFGELRARQPASPTPIPPPTPANY